MITKSGNGQKSLTKDQQVLVEKNIEFAMNMGKKFHGRGVSVDDLQQEACLALCEAALRYDAGKESQFCTYAYSYCLKYVMEAIRHDGDSLSADDDVELFGDAIVDDEVNHQEEYAIKVQTLLNTLTAKERQVITMVYGLPCDDDTQPEPLNFRQIANKLNLQPLRVKQLYGSAIDKMQKAGQ